MSLKNLGSWLSKKSSEGEEKNQNEKQETNPPKEKLNQGNEISKNNNFHRKPKKGDNANFSKKNISGNSNHQGNINQSGNINPPKDIKLRIIPLGGFEEVGKNSMIVEYGNDIILIDCGLQFAESEMLGIDYVIPDISYLESKKDKIKGIIITHGHLDHIGAVPHIMEKLGFPTIYATKLTNGLTKKRVEEFGILNKCKFVDINHKDTLKLGVFDIKPFRVNHSIPDGIGVRIKTPNGNIVHTGDFKFDFSPADGCQADYSRIAEIGAEGVVAAFVDSTNSGKEGFTMSEKVVGEALEKIIEDSEGRIIMALFSSLIGRISQIVDYAQKNGRQIFLSGRSLVNNIEIAQDLGYIRKPQGVIKKLSEEVNKLPPEKVIILCTGSQGEDLSALSRIARDDHPIITVDKNDTIVLSASPIIGNERSVVNVIDLLTAKGANVITNSGMDIHTSGHASQGELMLMYSLLKPKYLVPIHGELHMRVKHRNLIGERLNHSKDDMPILYNGSILEINNKGVASILNEKIRCEIVMVDGLGVGDIGTVVLKERQLMSENGTLIALYTIDKNTKKQKVEPDIISRGFIYVKESKKFVDEIKKVASDLYDKYIETNKDADIKTLRKIISNGILLFTDKKIKRLPMVIPIFVYV